MTPIDLRRAGPGWTVHFRCGGQARIGDRLTGGLFIFTFEDFCADATFSYHADGSFSGVPPHPLDIIALDPPPMTEAQMREALAEIAVVARRVKDCTGWSTISENIDAIVALAEGKP